MSKGSRRERQARKIYEAAGFWVYSPQNPKFGDNDLWNLFDLACFHTRAGELRLVQVKSNGARGITKWCHLARHFNATESIVTDFVVPYDQDGWRLVRPTGDAHTTVYDERNYSVPMGDGITRFLRGEIDGSAKGTEEP